MKLLTNGNLKPLTTSVEQTCFQEGVKIRCFPFAAYLVLTEARETIHSITDSAALQSPWAS